MISIAYLWGKCKQSGDFFDKCSLLDRFFSLCYANRKRGDDFVIRPNTSEQKRILILLSIVIGLLLIGIGCFGVLLHQKSAQEPAFHSGFHRFNRFHYNGNEDENGNANANDNRFNKCDKHNYCNDYFNHHGNNNHSSLCRVGNHFGQQ